MSMATDARHGRPRGGDQQVRASKLGRVDHAHDASLRVENRHGRDQFLALSRATSVPYSLHLGCLPSRKRATDAHARLPQAEHGSVPISKHVSQSRHTAIRPSGRDSARRIGPPFVLSPAPSRRGRGNPNLLKAVLSSPADDVFKPVALSTLKTSPSAPGIRFRALIEKLSRLRAICPKINDPSGLPGTGAGASGSEGVVTVSPVRRRRVSPPLRRHRARGLHVLQSALGQPA